MIDYLLLKFCDSPDCDLHESGSLPPFGLHPVYPAQKSCPCRGHLSFPEQRTFVSSSLSLSPFSYLSPYVSLFLSLCIFSSLSLSVSTFFFLSLWISPYIFLFFCFLYVSLLSLCICASYALSLLFSLSLYLRLLCSLSLSLPLPYLSLFPHYQFLTICYAQDVVNRIGN